MKLAVPFLAAALLLSPVAGRAADAAPADKAGQEQASEIETSLKDIVAKIQTKLQAGKKTQAELQENLDELEALVKKHAGEKNDDIAQVLFLEGLLYEQVMGNHAKSQEFVARIKKDYPESRVAKGITLQEEGDKMRASLVVGAKFPDFDEKDIAGKPVTIGQYKGKVVLIDFWATWCGPCVKELPNVLKAYETYHAKGLEIIGVSLDRDEKKLRSFVEKEKIAWAQIFDGANDNRLASKYGIQSIPTTYLLDGEGKIIDMNLRGEALEKAVAKALEKKS